MSLPENRDMFIPDRSLISLSYLTGRAKHAPFANQSVRFHATGRLALFYGLQALAAGRHSRIWLPAFLCRSVLDSVVQAGLTPCFYDINSRLDPVLEQADLKRGDFLLCVHFFGISASLNSIQKLCKEKGVRLIEDCAHSLPTPGDSYSHGSFGDMAIFSFRKQLPVPDGGMLVLNDKELEPGSFPQTAPDRSSRLKIVQLVSEKLAFMVGFNLVPWKDRFRAQMNSDTYGPAFVLREGASRFTRHALKRINWSKLIAKKRRNFQILSDYLRLMKGIYLPITSYSSGSVPQVFPVWADNPQNICRKLKRKGIAASQWPGDDRIESLDMDAYPGSRQWMQNGLCLPVHEDLTARQLKKIAEVLEQAVSSSNLRQAGAEQESE